MTMKNSGPRGPRAAWMAWNRPGGSGGTSSGGGFGALLDKLPDFGGGGGPLRWVGIALALWLAFNCFVLVAEQERGVVLRFGQVARVMQPGPNLKLPWPVERVIKVNATQIKNYEDRVPVLTRDENIVDVAVNVQYKVADPKLYLFGTRNGDEVLRQAALSTVREQVGRSDLDTVLGAREQLAVSARERLQKSLEAYRTGLVVTELNLPDARPPQQVKPAFDDVNSAQQDKERLISESRAYAAKIVPEARGQAARVRTVAEGYKNAPDVTRKRLWLETVQDVLARNRKIVGGDGRQLIWASLDGASKPVSPAPAALPELVSPTVESTAPEASARPGRSGRPTGREEVVR